MKKIITFLAFLLVLFSCFTTKLEAREEEHEIISYHGQALFSAYVSSEKILYMSGINGSGQLGRGYQSELVKLEPLGHKVLANIKTYVTGKSGFVVALTETGSLYGWGNNQYGQIGQDVTLVNPDSKSNSLWAPTTINLNRDIEIISIKAGARHTVLLDNEGRVYTFGDNSFGQLGINAVVSAENRKIAYGKPTKINQSYFNNMKVTQIESSEFTTYCLVENGDVYAFGDGYQGQLVDGIDESRSVNVPQKTLFENVKKISAFSTTVMALTNDNKVYIAGSNNFRQFGIKGFTELFSSTPIEINEFYDFSGNALVSGVKDIECGGISNFVILNDGSLCGFGSGGSKELGFSINEISNKYGYEHIELSNVLAPTKIKFYEPVSLDDLGEKIPYDQTKEILVDVSEIIFSSGNRTFVKDSNGLTWSFGDNTSGMISSGNLVSVDAPIRPTLYRISNYDVGIRQKNYLITPIVVLSIMAVGFGYIIIKAELKRKNEEQEVSSRKIKKRLKDGNI